MTAPRAPADRAELIEVMSFVIRPEVEDFVAADDLVRAVLAALEARGVRLVPRKATRRMINDGIDALNAGADAFVGADDAYQAVLAASPYAPEGE